METLTNPTESSNSPPPPAAASPSWVMLKRYNNNGDGGSSVTRVDAKTAAICRTTTGWLIRIAFLLAAPPATSTVHRSWVGDVPNDDERYVEGPHVVAAHDNVVLLQLQIPRDRRGSCTDGYEYVLYDAAGARQPSLSLLPCCYTSMQFQRKGGARRLVPRPCSSARTLSAEDTGVLRRGGEDDEVLVAQLEVGWDKPRDTAELCVLHRVPGGPCEWDLKRIPIVHCDGASGVDELMAPWKTDAVVPAGDRFMCWVDYFGGVLLCDMADRTQLRYVPLPVELDPDSAEQRYSSDRRPCMQSSRTLDGVGAACTLRFVSVDRRCCCGGAVGESKCARSRFAFMVTTWTMSLETTTTTGEPLIWVKNGVFDCDQLWALPGYGSLPRMPMEFPVVDFDDPDVVCFLLSNDYRGCGNLNRREDERVWAVKVNTRSKTLLSVLPQDNVIWGDPLVPAKLSIH